MISAKQARVGAGQMVWFAYVDGKMLRDKSGIGRRFKSEQTALEAAADDLPGFAPMSIKERADLAR